MCIWFRSSLVSCHDKCRSSRPGRAGDFSPSSNKFGSSRWVVQQVLKLCHRLLSKEHGSAALELRSFAAARAPGCAYRLSGGPLLGVLASCHGREHCALCLAGCWGHVTGRQQTRVGFLFFPLALWIKCRGARPRHFHKSGGRQVALGGGAYTGGRLRNPWLRERLPSPKTTEGVTL